MKQLNLAQTAILKFIENKDLTTKTTRFNAKYGKYAIALKRWVEGILNGYKPRTLRT